MNLGKFAKPVTAAKPVWHTIAFPPPTRMCTAPRNLATPAGKSPVLNTAIQQKKASYYHLGAKEEGAEQGATF
eukprot:gene4032-14111_t